MKKSNMRIRNSARNANIPIWEIASFLNVSEPTLFRWLRFPLEAEKEKRILNAIDEISRQIGK